MPKSLLLLTPPSFLSSLHHSQSSSFPKFPGHGRGFGQSPWPCDLYKQQLQGTFGMEDWEAWRFGFTAFHFPDLVLPQAVMVARKIFDCS